MEEIEERGMNGNIVVYLRGGSYYFNNPLEFTERDSGRNGYKVIYKNFKSEEPILNGGQRVVGWEAYDENIYRSYVGTNKVFHTVFENGHFSFKARHPNEDYNYAQEYRDASGSFPKTQIKFKDGDIPKINDISKLEINEWAGGPTGEWKWFQDFHSISKIDYTNNLLTFIGNARYELGPDSEYYIQGAMELLDQPGEFYLSNDGYLYYWPRKLPVEEQQIVIPLSDGLIKLTGKDENHIVRDICFEGITLQNTDRDSNRRFYAYDNAAIRLNNAAWLSFDKMKAHSIASTVCHMGGVSGGFAQNNSFTNSEIYDIGKDGIVMMGITASNAIQAEDALQTNSIKNRYNVVSNNKLDRFGMVTGHSYPIGMNESGYNLVSNNKILNSVRYAIAFNSYKTPLFNKSIGSTLVTRDNLNDFIYTRFNVIEYNDISYCFTDSEDVGAIYSYQNGRNNIIRNNAVYDNTMYDTLGYPIYLDDESDDCYVYNNLIYNNRSSDTGRLYANINSKGVGTKIFNNVYANNETDIYNETLCGGIISESSAVESERNIVYKSGYILYNIQPAQGAGVDLEINKPENRYKASDYNLFYNEVKEFQVRGMKPRMTSQLTEWLSWQSNKYDSHSIFNQDPQFMDAANRDYRFKFNSPVYKLRVNDINMSNIGLKVNYPYSDKLDTIDKVFIDVFDKNNNSFISINSGDSQALKVSARTQTGYMIDMKKAKVEFKIDNRDVASISDDGILLGKGKGIAILTATVTCNSVSKSTNFDILVDDTCIAESFKIDSTSKVYEVGANIRPSISLTTEFGKQEFVKNVRLESSNPEILKVDDTGGITAVAIGSATITAKYNYNGAEFVDSIVLSVKEALLSKVAAGLDKKIITLDETAILRISATDAKKNAFNIDNLNITVKSEDENQLKIKEVAEGIYEIAPLSSGYAKIFVTAEADGIIAAEEASLFIYAGEVDNEFKIANYSTKEFVTYGSGEVAKNGLFSIKSNGDNIYGNADKFTYLYKNIKLDNADEKIEIYSKIDGWLNVSGAENVANESHIGLMIRNNDTVGSTNVALRVMQSTGGIRVTDRKIPDGQSSFIAGRDVKFPVEIKLIKAGTIIRSFYKGDGDNSWIETSNIIANIGDEFLIGTVVYSGTKIDNKLIDAGAFGTVEIRRGTDVQIPTIQ